LKWDLNEQFDGRSRSPDMWQWMGRKEESRVVCWCACEVGCQGRVDSGRQYGCEFVIKGQVRKNVDVRVMNSIWVMIWVSG